MSSKSPHNPHDRLFKRTFSQKQVVRTYCENFLPEELVEQLQLDQLERVPDTFIDQKLQVHFSDMVYRCPFGSAGNEVLLTLLFEHKSFVPKFPHLQLLRYMVNVWEDQIARHQEKEKEAKEEQKPKEKLLLSPVIPIVFYHGKTTWKVQPFKEYFQGGEDEVLAGFIPKVPYLLTDVEDYSPEAVQKMKLGWLGATMMAFLLSKDPQKTEEYFELIWHYLYEKTEESLDLRKEFFVYFIKTLTINPQTIQQMIPQLPPSLRKKDLTTFEQMVAQAGEKWLAEHGEDLVTREELERVVQEKEKQMREKERQMQEEKELLRKATIRAGLKANLPMETLMEMTSLSQEKLRRIIKQLKEEEKSNPDSKA